MAFVRPRLLHPAAKTWIEYCFDRLAMRARFVFIGTANQNGFLGKFTSRPIQARDRFHAEEIAFRASGLLA